jgi:hypothetical protein
VGKKFLAYMFANETACRAAGKDEPSCTGAPHNCFWEPLEMPVDGVSGRCSASELPLETFFACDDKQEIHDLAR